jgi:uncharacterized membrane protein YqgA involved in biofilm formation
MIGIEVFLFGLMITSTLTGLVTEAIKKILTEYNRTYRANTLAGIVATVLSIAIGIGYIIATGSGFTAQIIICLIAQVFLSWLCSMVGYDKVVEIFTKTKKGE